MTKRAALCLSGQLRNLEKTYNEYIKPNLFDCNPDWSIDTFVHTWFDFTDIGKEYELAAGGSGSTPIPEEVLAQLYKFYNPTKVLLEKQVEFDEKNYNSRKARLIRVKFSLSKMYSIKQSSLLKTKYEEENGFKYDLVVLCRSDLGMEKPIDLNEFTPDAYCCSCHGNINGGVDVSHAFMGSDIFDTFANLYHEVEKCWNTGVKFVDEQLAGVHLRTHKIPIQKYDSLGHYHLVRG